MEVKRLNLCVFFGNRSYSFQILVFIKAFELFGVDGTITVLVYALRTKCVVMTTEAGGLLRIQTHRVINTIIKHLSDEWREEGRMSALNWNHRKHQEPENVQNENMRIKHEVISVNHQTGSWEQMELVSELWDHLLHQDVTAEGTEQQLLLVQRSSASVRLQGAL